MKLFKKTILTSIGLILLNTASALPPRFSADYTVKHGNITLGTMKSVLNYSGNRYVYKKDSAATGLASLVSGLKINEYAHGQTRNNNFAPQGYTYFQKRRNKEKRTQFQFVTPNKVSGVFKGEKHTFPVPSGTLDRATLELTLADALSKGRTNLRYNLVEKGEAKGYKFAILGTENLNTPAGQYSCTKIEVQRQDQSRKTYYWMAKELDYLPVKMYHNEKGSAITTTLKSIKITK